MAESRASAMRDSKRLEGKPLHLRNQKSPVTTVRCRKDLQSTFNAVANVKELRDRPGSKESETNSVSPRCSTCKTPGGLRHTIATSACNVCDVRIHRNNDGHGTSPIQSKLGVAKHFLAKNGYHQLPVCHEGHKDVPKYFCETCQDVVCLECIETRHKKHQFVYAKDAYGKHKMTLEKYIVNARAEADRIVKQLDQGDDMMNELQTEKDEIAAKIKAQTEIIMDVVRSREKELLHDVEKIYSHKEDVLSKNRERLQNRLELIQRTCRFTEIAMNDGDEVQVLIFEKYARRRLQELCRADVLAPATGRNPRYYVANSSAEKAEELLGKIVCSSVEPSQCEAHGEGLGRAVVGRDSCFLVNAKDKDSIPLTTGGDNVQAQVTTHDGQSLEARVSDQGNGTYTVTYSPQVSGLLHVAVRVYGEAIKTPECKVHVECQRDYGKIEKPSLIISRLILSGKESTLRLPCGVAVDKQGRILVADCHNHSIKIFSRDGKFIKSFGCFGSKNGQMSNPTDIAVHEDKIYVCDKDNSRVQCFTSQGVFLRKFSRGSVQLKRPWGICIDSKGHVVVADTKNNQIQVFSRDGQFVASFGKEGSGESEFLQPYFIAAHSNGRIFVTDNGNHRVQVFDENYSYLFQFGGDSTGDDGNGGGNGGDDGNGGGDGGDRNGCAGLRYPTGIITDHQGHVIVADQCNSRLQVYQANGEHKAVITKALNTTEECPSYPKGLAVTQDGHIVVADSDNDKIVLL